MGMIEICAKLSENKRSESTPNACVRPGVQMALQRIVTSL